MFFVNPKMMISGIFSWFYWPSFSSLPMFCEKCGRELIKSGDINEGGGPRMICPIKHPWKSSSKQQIKEIANALVDAAEQAKWIRNFSN